MAFFADAVLMDSQDEVFKMLDDVIIGSNYFRFSFCFCRHRLLEASALALSFAGAGRLHALEYRWRVMRERPVF